MQVMVEFNYNAKNKIASLDREKYLFLREAIPQMNIPDWPETKVKPPYWYQDEQTLIDLETDGKILLQFELEYIIKRFKGAYFTQAAGGRYSTNKDAYQSHDTYIQVSIPDLALLHIREVKVLDDACTDELQSQLKEGWRIIAVCPPNSQRRPDYILGRT